MKKNKTKQNQGGERRITSTKESASQETSVVSETEAREDGNFSSSGESFPWRGSDVFLVVTNNNAALKAIATSKSLERGVECLKLQLLTDCPVLVVASCHSPLPFI